MNVSFCIFWWFNLHDQVDTWDVQATRGDVSGDQDIAFELFELLEGDFALPLTNLTVDDFDVLARYLVGDFDLVRFLLLSAEYDGLTATVAGQDVCESCLTVLVWAVDGKMLNLLGGLLFKIFHQIENAVAWPEECTGDLLDPVRNRGGEHKRLDIWGSCRFNGSHNGLNVFLETHVKHPVSLIEHRIL